METKITEKQMNEKPLRRALTNPSKYTVTFITTARESNNELTELEVILFPGGSNQVHRHLNFTETFIPVSGTLEVRLGGGRILNLEPGAIYTVPIGTAHCFANPGNETVKFRVVIRPGHEGFEYSLRMLYGLAEESYADLKTWNDFLRAAVILSLGDMRLCGREAIINPFIEFLLGLAKKKGIYQTMMTRYIN